MKEITRFTKSVPLQGEEYQFEFHPMNVRALQLFQVYSNFEGKQFRFHMQRRTKDGRFCITDVEKIPAEVPLFEKELSALILAEFA
jgi:hypothetical protein